MIIPLNYPPIPTCCDGPKSGILLRLGCITIKLYTSNINGALRPIQLFNEGLHVLEPEVLIESEVPVVDLP